MFSIRAPEPEDLQFLYTLENDVENWSVTDTQMPISKDTLKAWLFGGADIYETKNLRMLIVTPEGVRVGCVDITDIDFYHLHGSVGIWVDAKHRNRGVAKYAINWLANYAQKHLGLRNLIAHVGASNKASIRLFESCGYAKTGLRPSFHRIGANEWQDLHIFQKEL